MLGLVLSVGFVGWLVAIVLTSNNRVTLSAKLFVDILAVSSFFFGLYLLYRAYYYNNESLSGNIGTTIVSIAVTITVLDRLNERRRLEERKQEIFEEMESPVRDVAVEAVRLARKYGWLDEALKEVYLMGAQLAGVDFSNINLQGVTLSFANLQDANLLDTNLQKAHMNNANLQEARISRSNLQDAYLFKANLQGANLFRADLQGADLNNAKLQRAIFTQASLQRTNLCKTNLQGAVLRKANLQGAKYDEKTTWPEGFDPIAAGAILVPLE